MNRIQPFMMSTSMSCTESLISESRSKTHNAHTLPRSRATHIPYDEDAQRNTLHRNAQRTYLKQNGVQSSYRTPKKRNAHTLPRRRTTIILNQKSAQRSYLTQKAHNAHTLPRKRTTLILSPEGAQRTYLTKKAHNAHT